MSPTLPPHSALEALDAHLVLIASDIERWLTLFAEDAVVEFPYAASMGLPSRLAGRQAIWSYFSRTPDVFKELTFRDLRRYATTDARVAIAEVHGSAKLGPTARAYEQDYVMFLEVQEGRIVRYREYWNTARGKESFGADDVARAMGVR